MSPQALQGLCSEPQNADVVSVFSYSEVRNNGIATIRKPRDTCVVDGRAVHANVALAN